MNKVATNIVCVQFCVGRSLYDPMPILGQLKACPWVLSLPNKCGRMHGFSLDFVQAHLDVICMSIRAIGYVFFYLFKLKKFFYNVVLVSAIQQSQKEKNK